jgi:hypothetical protein
MRENPFEKPEYPDAIWSSLDLRRPSPMDVKQYTRSLSDFGIVGCNSAAAVHISPAPCPMVWLCCGESDNTGLARVDFHYRRPESDRRVGYSDRRSCKGSADKRLHVFQRVRQTG